MNKHKHNWHRANGLSHEDQIVSMLEYIIKQGDELMAKIDDLEAAVKRETDAEDSVVILLQGLSQQLKDAQTDPARLAAVIKSIDDNTAKLSAAVVANTPVA